MLHNPPGVHYSLTFVVKDAILLRGLKTNPTFVLTFSLLFLAILCWVRKVGSGFFLTMTICNCHVQYVQS